WLHLGSLILAPAVAFNIGSGQNAFLTSALLIGGFILLPSRPGAGGVLLGVLTYKPQLWLLAPVALVAAREWRALAATVLTPPPPGGGRAPGVGVPPWRGRG